VMEFLRHPGDTAVRFDHRRRGRSSGAGSSVSLDGKQLVVNLSASWDGFDHDERTRRFTALCSILANRFYHGAALVAPSGRPVGSWRKGLIQVE